MIFRILTGLASRARNLYWKLRGVRLMGYCRLGRLDIPRLHSTIMFGPGASLEDGCSVIATKAEGAPAPSVFLGRGIYVNRGVIFDACESIHVSENVMIGPYTYITDHDHSISGDRRKLLSARTCIGENAWIGANVTILKGVTIGKGSVIGAGSVVTKSIPENSVAVGNPARVVRTIEPEGSEG